MLDVDNPFYTVAVRVAQNFQLANALSHAVDEHSEIIPPEILGDKRIIRGYNELLAVELDEDLFHERATRNT